MEISSAKVKELRERTGAGMMDCKKALQEARGDIEAAIEAMRKSGVAKAAKKAGRIAAEGNIVFAGRPDRSEAVLVEVNCETDFVAKDGNFRSFAEAVGAVALASGPANVEELMKVPLPGGALSAEEVRLQLVAKLGENINVRRFQRLRTEGGTIGSYVHSGRIGVLVDLHGGGEELARNIAMHIAAANPICVTESELPADLVGKEREIACAEAANSGKPPEIVEKMVNGKLAKFKKEASLLGQAYVREPELNVGKLLQQQNAKVRRFVRLEVGEGIEKKADNFAAEVMAQVKGA